MVIQIRYVSPAGSGRLDRSTASPKAPQRTHHISGRRRSYRYSIILISAMGSPFSIAVHGYTLVSSQTKLTHARGGHAPICAGNSLLVLHHRGRAGALRHSVFTDEPEPWPAMVRRRKAMARPAGGAV